MKEWLEQGNGPMIPGIVAGMVVFVRLLLFGYYGRLYKECRRFEMSRHKSLLYIREDLKRRTEKGQEIKNAMTYTECRLAECKVLGVRIGWLENIILYSTLFVLLCGVMTAFVGVMLACEEMTILFLLFVSGAAVLGLLATDMVLGLREKYRRIRLLVRDYVENNWSVRKEWPEEHRMPEASAEAVMKTAEKPKRTELKKRTPKDKPVKAESRKKGKAQEEKRRLTEELLRERRQLEARSFAEQRKKEQEMQAERQETEPEKKDATSSYELLMREVLAEYLA